MINEMPIGLGFIVCDSIIEDMHTRKKSLIGLFDRIIVEKVPAVIPKISVFVALTSGNGKYKCELLCESPNGKKIISGKGEIAMRSPIDVIDINFNFMNIPFDVAGKYALTFLINDFPIMSRQITVDLSQKS